MVGKGGHFNLGLAPSYVARGRHRSLRGCCDRHVISLVDISSLWCPLLKVLWLVLSITVTRRSEDHRRCRGLPDAMPVGGFYRDLLGFRQVPPGARESSMGVSWGAVQNLVAPGGAWWKPGNFPYGHGLRPYPGTSTI